MSARVTDHGTSAMYKRCQGCDDCLAYQRDRVKANRADRLTRLQATDDMTPARFAWQDPIGHGTPSSYDAGCRCGLCTRSRSRGTP
jgi:hypothetical protein